MLKLLEIDFLSSYESRYDIENGKQIGCKREIGMKLILLPSLSLENKAFTSTMESGYNVKLNEMKCLYNFWYLE